jgi:predicted enzyme related to lactoylglutathione lyase
MLRVSDCYGQFVWQELITTVEPSSLSLYSGLFPEWRVHEVEMREGILYRIFEVNGLDIGGMLEVGTGDEVVPHWMTGIAVDDCDAVIARAVELGGVCRVPSYETPDVGRLAIIEDGLGTAVKLFDLAHPQPLPTVPQSGGIGWHHLLVSEGQLGPAADFYTAVFGWQLQEVGGESLSTAVIFSREDRPIASASVVPAGMPVRPRSWLPVVRVGDFEERRELAEALGATVIVPNFELPGHRWAVALEDPGGAHIALASLPEAATR